MFDVSDDIPNSRPPAAQASRYHDAYDPGVVAGLFGSTWTNRGGFTASSAQGMEAVRVPNEMKRNVLDNFDLKAETGGPILCWPFQACSQCALFMLALTFRRGRLTLSLCSCYGMFDLAFANRT